MKQPCLLAALLCGWTALPVALAADGAWTQTNSGGLWSDTGTWNGGVVADGAGVHRRFQIRSTLQTTSRCSLDSARTIGSIIFGNSDGAPGRWFLDNNGDHTNTLTLGGVVPNGGGDANGIVVNAGSGAVSVTADILLAGSQTWTNNGVGNTDPNNAMQNLPALTVASVSNGSYLLTIASDGGLLTHAAYNTVITNYSGGGGGLTLAGNSSPVSPGVTVSIGTATLSADERWTNNGVGNTDPNNAMQNLPALSVATVSNGGHVLTIASEGGLLTSAGYNTVITNYNGSGGGLTLAGNSSLASPDVTVSIGTATLTGDETWTNNGVGFYNGSQNLPGVVGRYGIQWRSRADHCQRRWPAH